MDHTIPLWASTTTTAALFAVSLIAARRLGARSANYWSAAFGILLLRVGAGHIPPHGDFADAALYLARVASPGFTLLFCLGALHQAGVRPNPRPLVAGGMAAGGWLAILTHAGAYPPLAVAPAETFAALFCLYTLRKASRSDLTTLALWLLTLRAALRPLTFNLNLDPVWVLALSALTWSIPAIAMIGALFDQLTASHKDELAGVKITLERDVLRNLRASFIEQLAASPERRLLIEPRSGQIVDGSDLGLAHLGLTRGGAKKPDLWEFAQPGQGAALRDTVASLPGKTPPATITLAIGGKSALFLATARQLEFDGRLLLDVSLTPAPADASSRLETSGALAAGFAHDLKNVLQTILSCSDGLARNGRADSDAAQAIAESARKGDRLVRKILSGGEPDFPRPEEIDLKKLLETLAATFRPSLPAGIVLSTSLGDAPVTVTAAGDVVEQAVLNLLVNAREALVDNGRIHLTLSVRGTSALVAVEDDGPGVEPTLRGKIFEPLMTTKGRPGGLGLSMVRSTLGRFGGSVECAHGLELPGALFTIALPLVLPKPGRAILIIDADDTARGELDRKLKLAGHLVYTTDDGDRALAILKDKGSLIGTVVTDLVTRGLGGRNLLKALNTQCPHARVLVVSSIASQSARTGSLAAGAKLFFTKAEEGEALLAALSEG